MRACFYGRLTPPECSFTSCFIDRHRDDLLVFHKSIYSQLASQNESGVIRAGSLWPVGHARAIVHISSPTIVRKVTCLRSVVEGVVGCYAASFCSATCSPQLTHT